MIRARLALLGVLFVRRPCAGADSTAAGTDREYSRGRVYATVSYGC